MIAKGYSDINLLYKSQILMNLGLVFCKKKLKALMNRRI
jgi:hypothetical protein